MEYVYIIRCGDGSLYTGWTNNLEKRFKAHQAGKGAKYTRGRGPLELVHVEVFDERLEAQKRERAIKRLTRAQKLELIDSCRTGEKSPEYCGQNCSDRSADTEKK